LPDVGAPCNPPPPPQLTACPPGQGSDIGYPGGSEFVAATEVAPADFDFGGIYGHIYPAPACADSTSNPPTSSWVVLEAVKDQPHVFAQAGLFYGNTGQRPGVVHPFFEVEYPELPTGVNGTDELDFPLDGGTFTVQVYGPSHQPIPIACGDQCTTTTSNTEEILFSQTRPRGMDAWSTQGC
jgi:hypothetical protein